MSEPFEFTEDHEFDETPADLDLIRQIDRADYPAVLWAAEEPFEDAA